jgi:hypothetical protein
MIPFNKVINLSKDVPGFHELFNNKSSENNSLSSVQKLNIIDGKPPFEKYKIIRYDKNVLSIDLIPTYGLCRSIILNDENKVLGFSPPKSIPCDHFIKKYPSKSDTIIAEEFIEGTMINVFWDDKLGVKGGWEIATRNTVGAGSYFYKSPNAKSFRTMFLEAAYENKLILENLSPSYCYSFVMQHPDNRIVVPFQKKKLYLIGIYHIQYLDNNNICVYSKQINQAKNYDWMDATIYFPKQYEFQTYSELIEQYASMNTSYDIVGVVIKNLETNERTKIRNPVYEQVKSLRGNQPKLQYQYLCLRKEGKVAEYLKFYPENKKDFSLIRNQIHLFTNTLFSNYLSCYVKKSKPLIEFSEQYRTHMFQIHKIYTDELREKKLFITNTHVIRYVNGLHPSLLMYSLNYSMRKRNVDSVCNS